MKVFFIKVLDNAQKLQTICSLGHYHFFKNEPLVIMTPSAVAAQYIDDLLWKAPPTSFLPHGSPNSDEKVIIAQEGDSLGQPTSLLNLGDKHLYLPKKNLYELWDETSLPKKEMAEKKLLYYQSQGFEINFITPSLLTLTV